jgi:hypothetical protein
LNPLRSLALQVSLAVQQEIQGRLDETDRLRRKRVERAEYETDQARHRYMQVDPANRLVADSLEADWNQKLRALNEARDEYEQHRSKDRVTVEPRERERIFALADDFPAVWQNSQTPQRERKRMVRLMIEDVTLIKRDHVTAHVRFRGGATQTLTLPLPQGYFHKRRTRPEVVMEIDKLLEGHSDKEVAEVLNARGSRSGAGQSMTVARVAFIRTTYNLKSFAERLRDAGMLTAIELAKRLDVAPQP